MTSSPQIWIKTDFFDIEPGEDEATNPGRFGKSMANWLAWKFSEGEVFQGAKVLGEDWGWCVMLQRKPFPLWVGCGNRFDTTDEWGAFVTAEPNLLYKIRHGADVKRMVDGAFQMLGGYLRQLSDGD
ncbi:hypothetical protein DYGSA30_31470 [Dyella sp. GSA-30]|nr:hypothetical protein DYGSA30_31470 [Dyella sp. GSA-30]